jgi:uncharacterized protein (DUF1330 family)
MPGSQKRIPKNSIFIIVKFDSREQVIDMLKDEDYKAAYSNITSLALIKGGECECFKSFRTL